MKKSFEFWTIGGLLVVLVLIVAIPIFSDAVKKNNELDAVQFNELDAVQFSEAKCQDFCITVVEHLSSLTNGFDLRHVEICQNSCKRINESGIVPFVIIYGERDCKESCSTQCSYGKPCPNAARCYESCLAKLAKEMPSNQWYFNHKNPGSTICHEEKCVNDDCSSLFSKLTFRQEAISNDPLNYCDDCYARCTSR